MIDRRALVLAAMFAPFAAGALAHPHGELDLQRLADIERQVNAFRVAFKDAAAARDVMRIRAMYEESFTHTHTTGQVDGRDARVTQVVGGDPVFELAPATEVTIRIFGPDMAVVAGRSPIHNRRENRMVDVRWTQVLSRASGDWRIATSMAVRLPTTA